MDRPVYPDPPWQTHGFGVFCPCVVPVRHVRIPAPFEPVARFGRCAGLLAYVEYRPPSPLTYAELIWMPTLVRIRDAEGRERRGWWVARMHVDDEASLAGGRELWNLPKTLGRFERTERGVRMTADRDTDIELAFRARGPAVPVRSRMTTLQPGPQGAIRFRAEVRARTRVGRLRVARFDSDDPDWQSLRHARLSPAATVLDPFDSTMGVPEPLTVG